MRNVLTYRRAEAVESNGRGRDTNFKYILNFKLLYFQVNDLYMESDDTEIKSLTKSRFGSVIFLFRLAGIPFQMKTISTSYAVYMRTVITCACTTYAGMLVDVYVHMDDLGHSMTNMRVLIPVTNIMWIYTYCRYVRTLATATAAHKYLFMKHSITVSAMT
jgi:hypothetical protein